MHEMTEKVLAILKAIEKNDFLAALTEVDTLDKEQCQQVIKFLGDRQSAIIVATFLVVERAEEWEQEDADDSNKAE